MEYEESGDYEESRLHITWDIDFQSSNGFRTRVAIIISLFCVWKQFLRCCSSCCFETRSRVRANLAISFNFPLFRPSLWRILTSTTIWHFLWFTMYLLFGDSCLIDEASDTISNLPWTYKSVITFPKTLPINCNAFPNSYLPQVVNPTPVNTYSTPSAKPPIHYRKPPLNKRRCQPFWWRARSEEAGTGGQAEAWWRALARGISQRRRIKHQGGQGACRGSWWAHWGFAETNGEGIREGKDLGKRYPRSMVWIFVWWLCLARLLYWQHQLSGFRILTILKALREYWLSRFMSSGDGDGAVKLNCTASTKSKYSINGHARLFLPSFFQPLFLTEKRQVIYLRISDWWTKLGNSLIEQIPYLRSSD